MVTFLKCSTSFFFLKLFHSSVTETHIDSQSDGTPFALCLYILVLYEPHQQYRIHRLSPSQDCILEHKLQFYTDTACDLNFLMTIQLYVLYTVDMQVIHYQHVTQSLVISEFQRKMTDNMI